MMDEKVVDTRQMIVTKQDQKVAVDVTNPIVVSRGKCESVVVQAPIDTVDGLGDSSDGVSSKDDDAKRNEEQKNQKKKASHGLDSAPKEESKQQQEE